MMARSTPTPHEQGPPPATMNPPATPGRRRSSTASISVAPATPISRQHTLPPTTPGSSSVSPFPSQHSYTPGLRTPSVTTSTCTSDQAQFTIVKVHTAKCTECDKRNMDTMRRCPGCTFQVCKPCYERREREGRGLMHGNLMSGVPTPATQRTVRRKPLGVTDTPKAAAAEKVEVKDGQVEAAAVNHKDGQNITSTPKRQVKKRTLQKKRKVQDTPSASSSSDDDYMHDSPSSMPSKRRRTAPASSSTVSSRSPGTLTRTARKPAPTPTPSTSRPPTLVRNESTMAPQPSKGVRVGEMDVDTLMATFGVNTAANPYDEHPLNRREPVMSNPVIEIPAIVKRGFKPRPSAEEIQKNIQEKVLKRMEAKHEQAKQEAHSHTVRACVEAEAAKHQEKAALDEDDKEALFDAIKVEARKWCTQIYGGLDPELQKKVGRGLNMRLDLVGQYLKEQLAVKLAACATFKLQEFEEESR